MNLIKLNGLTLKYSDCEQRVFRHPEFRQTRAFLTPKVSGDRCSNFWAEHSNRIFKANTLDTSLGFEHHSPGPGAIMDVGAWLRGLGLGQYEDRFRDGEIEADILPELTETDLEKLGLPLGHRKRI